MSHNVRYQLYHYIDTSSNGMFTINLRREKKAGMRFFKPDAANNTNIVPLKIEFNIDQQWKKTSKLKTSPSATFGKASRDSSPNSMQFRPGPGSYQLSHSDFDKKFSHHRIVLNKRRNLDDTQNEGSPKNQQKHSFYENFSQSKLYTKVAMHSGSFEEEERERQSKLSKQNRLDVIDKQRNPGPGAYDVPLSLSQAKRCLFSKAVRKLTESNKNPGPADYHAQRSMLNQEGGSISRMKRLFNYQTPTPGPGFYKQVSMNSIKKKDSFAIINRSFDTTPKKGRDTPGPGSYLKEQSIRNCKITGGVIARSVMMIKTQESPGPMSYSPNFKDVLTKSASFVIGKSNIKSKAVATTGYGSYKIQRQDSCLKRQLTDLGTTNITINIDRYSKFRQNRSNDITKNRI